MQLQPADILTRKEKDGQTVWISQRLLVDVCGISDGLFRKNRTLYKKALTASQLRPNIQVLPDTGKAWRWARMQGGFYYALPNIPDRAPSRYRSMLPSEEELLAAAAGQQVQKGSELREHAAAEIRRQVGTLVQADDVQYYRYDSRPTFPPEKARGLARSLAWLRYLRQAMDTGSYERMGIRRKTDFMDICAKAIGKEANHGLETKSAQYLYSRLADFPPVGVDAQRRAMIPGRYGNQNALRVGKYPLVNEQTGEEHPFDLHQTLMYNLYMNPGSPVKEDREGLYRKYLVEIEGTGIKPVALRTFNNHLTRMDMDILTARQTHGKDYLKKFIMPYTPTGALRYAHSLFAIDGSGLNSYRYWRETRDRKTGKVKKEKKTMGLYAILVSDVASRYIAGYSVAPEGTHKETFAMTESAVKMAVQQSGYQTMFELVSDNHGAFSKGKGKEFLKEVFQRVRTIEKNNSQANPAETQFRLFNKVLKTFKSFVSGSWNAGIRSKSNPDFINWESLPDYYGAIQELEEAIHQWNNKVLPDGTTPAERFANKHPDCKPMDARQVRRLFGHKTRVDLSYMRGFVNVESVRQGRFKFEIPDFAGKGSQTIAKATGYGTTATMDVYWDENAADLYTLEGKYIMTCLPAKLSIMAEAERTEAHKEAQEYHKKRKEEILTNIERFEQNVASAKETVRQLKEDMDDTGEEVPVKKLPYEHAMALGGNKESYNGSMEGLEEEETTDLGEKDTPWTDEDRIRAYARSQM